MERVRKLLCLMVKCQVNSHYSQDSDNRAYYIVNMWTVIKKPWQCSWTSEINKDKTIYGARWVLEILEEPLCKACNLTTILSA